MSGHQHLHHLSKNGRRPVLFLKIIATHGGRRREASCSPLTSWARLAKIAKRGDEAILRHGRRDGARMLNPESASSSA